MSKRSAVLAGVFLLQVLGGGITPILILSAQENVAAEVLSRAQQEASAIENAYLREIAFKDIAVAQARANHPGKALEIVSELSQRADKNLTLVEIAEAQAKADHLPAAFETVARIDDETDRAVALEAVALAQLSAGDPAGALRTAHRIPEEINRSSVLMHLAIREAEFGNVTHAIGLAHQIPGPFRRDKAFQGIALVQMKLGNSRGGLIYRSFYRKRDIAGQGLSRNCRGTESDRLSSQGKALDQ